jgi:hypothetical protein
MSFASRQSEPVRDPQAFRDSIAALLAQGDGADEPVDGIHVDLFEYSSSYPAYVVTVALAGGEKLKLFLKDHAYSILAKDDLRLRGRREHLVYRRLLADADLGQPGFYGSVWDEEEERFWLLLEFVTGTLIRDCEFEDWVTAVRWLGRLQRHFANQLDRLESCDFLAEHDTEFFMSRAERALPATAEFSPRLGQRLEVLVTGYEEIVKVMVAQPKTLVHGVYRPQNIIVHVPSQPCRVCPTDWERAAIGSPLYDLAFLCDGYESEDLYRLWDAYGEELARDGGSLPDRDRMRYLTDCVRLHRVMNWLSLSRSRRYPPGEVAGLVALGERLSAGLR